MKKKPQELITVNEFAKTLLSRRGFPVSVQYVYKRIAEHKKTGKKPPFGYVEQGKGIKIIKPN